MPDSKPATEGAHALVNRFLAPTSGVHAVLFYGAEEGPTLDAAYELAKGWLCLSSAEAGACGECRACVAFGRSNHVDFKLIVPKGASAIIKIGAITARTAEPGEEAEISMQEFFRTQPLFGPRKVAVISSADRMNSSAANSLLKMLEEPHPYAKIILTTTALGEILPTVISRCVNVPVPVPSGFGSTSPGERMIEDLAAAIGSAGPVSVLAFSERLREASEKFQSDQNLPARNAHCMALMALARHILARYKDRPEWAQATIEAHRRVLGNANATLVFDSLLTKLLLGLR